MANADQVINSVMSLPLPPAQYIQQFSNENLRKNRAPKPPPPIQDVYSMFGSTFNNDDMIRSLESQGFRRLIPVHFDRHKELKKLNHSLFANFLDLIDLLVHFPDSPRRAEKIDDLSLLFVHIHHLLNEFRPHQARETLRVVMEMQKRARVETCRRFNCHLERAHEIIKSALQALPDRYPMDEKLPVQLQQQQRSANGGACSSLLDAVNASAKGPASGDACDQLDRIMCAIVDECDML